MFYSRPLRQPFSYINGQLNLLSPEGSNRDQFIVSSSAMCSLPLPLVAWPRRSRRLKHGDWRLAARVPFLVPEHLPPLIAAAAACCPGLPDRAYEISRPNFRTYDIFCQRNTFLNVKLLIRFFVASIAVRRYFR